MSTGARPPQTGVNFACTPRCNTLGGNAMQHDPPRPSATRHGAGRDSTTRRATAQANPIQCFLPPKKSPGTRLPMFFTPRRGAGSPVPPSAHQVRCGAPQTTPGTHLGWVLSPRQGDKALPGAGWDRAGGTLPHHQVGDQGDSHGVVLPPSSGTSATSGAGDVGDDDGKKRSPRSSPNTPQPPPLPFPGAV